jgi:hypothetical protein
MKQSIILSWGAMLYSSDKYIPLPRPDTDRSLSSPRLSKEQVWSQLSARAMTGMVLSLDFIRVIGDTIHTHYCSWSLHQLSSLLDTLQCCFDQARCFNADSSLRTHLRSKSFMRFRDNPSRLPHLLEQETRAAAQIMVICFRLYSEGASDGVKAKLAEPILKRYVYNPTHPIPL